MVNFRTKPRGEQLSFLTDCWKCSGEISITNGRVEAHMCRPITLYATHEEVAEGQAFRHDTMTRLNAIFNR